MRADYLWYTIVIGANAFLQFVVPYIVWYGGLKQDPVNSMPIWKVTAYRAMMATHTIAFSIQAALWGFTYIEKY